MRTPFRFVLSMVALIFLLPPAQALAAPATPTNFRITFYTGTDLQVQWDAVVPAPAGYKLYYRANAAGPPWDGSGAVEGASPIDVGDVTNFTLTGLTSGTLYALALTAYDAGGGQSAYSVPAGTLAIANPGDAFLIDAGNFAAFTVDGVGAPAGGSVSVSAFGSEGDGSTDVTTAAGDGSWSTAIDFSPFAEGAVTLQAAAAGVTSRSVSGTYDRSAPQIVAGPTVTYVSNDTAIVEWRTDEPATGTVEYGLTTAYGSLADDPSYVVWHIEMLTGLSPGSVYHFRISSTDANGQGPSTSADLTFATDADPDTTPPFVESPVKIDWAAHALDIHFSEPVSAAVADESNYSFDPALAFRTSGDTGDDIVYLGDDTYRLYLATLPDTLSTTLTLSNVQDTVGLSLTPNAVLIAGQSPRPILIDLYNATDGDHWVDNSGWKDGELHVDGFALPGSECSWAGVACDGSGSVTQIVLTNNNLAGELPASLGDLATLEVLHLDHNRLSGALPGFLGALANLSDLQLHNNAFTGAIPTEIGDLTALTRLQLSGNQLTGAIPASLGNLVNLTHLYLDNNQLSGPLPSSLGNLTALQYLYLNGNDLWGPLPVEITNLTALVDGQSDFRGNIFYTANTTIRDFLNAKQTGGDWQSYQTAAAAGGVTHLRNPDGSSKTYFCIVIHDAFASTIPDDIATISVSGPGGTLPYTKEDFTYTFTEFWQSHDFCIDTIEGAPETGLYTFTATNGVSGETAASTDTQGTIRDLPIPDAAAFQPGDGSVVANKTPTFSWQAVDYTETTVYYRLVVREAGGPYVFFSSRTAGMTAFTLPDAVLQPNTAYEWKVQVFDSGHWVSADNMANSAWATFATAATLSHPNVPAVDLDGYGAATWTGTGGTNLDCWVIVTDHDGIASDGSSHAVSVSVPGGATYPLNVSTRYSATRTAYTASVDFTGGTIPDGDYTFTVTDPDGNTGSAVDSLVVDPQAVPDPGSFSVDTSGALPVFSWDPTPGAARYRIRLYTADGSRTLWNGYTSDTTYAVPPGVLQPDTQYRYRIDAYREHSPLDTDNKSGSNRITFTTGTQVSNAPWIELNGDGVQVWNGAQPGRPYLNFWITVHDAQGVSDNIRSVIVEHPNGEIISLYFQYSESSTSGYYGNISHLPVEAGTYTFTVEDWDGNGHSVQEELAVDPLPYPAVSSLRPVHNTVVGDTGVTFDWADVPGTAFYRVEIYDLEMNRLFALPTTESRYQLPAGFLEDGCWYRYRVTSRREFFSQNVDNVSVAPWSRYDMPMFVTTPTIGGAAAPVIDLAAYGAAVRSGNDFFNGGETFWLTFNVKVQDGDGVPGNIASVTVTYPDQVTTRKLAFDSAIDATTAWYWYKEVHSSPQAIQSGLYRFLVTDCDGNTMEAFDHLVVKPLPAPTGLSPGDDTLLYDATPTVDWDDVSEAVAYRVDVFAWETDHRTHDSGTLQASAYTVPAQVLESGTAYNYRVNAYREDPDVDVDNLSVSGVFAPARNHFLLPPADLMADSDGDGLLDAWEKDNFGDLSRDGTGDGDADGLNDLGEFQNGTDPDVADTDGDGMPDGFEVTGDLDPFSDDADLNPDGDTLTNLEEYEAGTDPAVYDVTLQTGLVAYYPFDGNAIDASGNGNDGVVNGAVLETDRFGRSDSAYRLDGADDYLSFADVNSLDGMQRMTISFWINPFFDLNESSARQDFLYKENSPTSASWSIVYGNEPGQLSFYITDDTGTWEAVSNLQIDFQANRWYHIFVTFKSLNASGWNFTDLGLVVDFDRWVSWNSSSEMKTLTMLNSSAPLSLGRRPDGQYLFNGMIDDVRIYNRTLGSSEVETLYNQFFATQAIPTHGARDWESFTIDGETYLAVANYTDGASKSIASKIYRFNGGAWEEVQAIATQGAQAWESFIIDGEMYLAVANMGNDATYLVDSKIYRWNGSQFVEIQAVPTAGAAAWESFTIGGETYLAVANSFNGSSYNIDSVVYRWNGTAFVEVQRIPTHTAWDWESFKIAGESYLAVANYFDDADYAIDSVVYRWNGSAFVEAQRIPTRGANDWESFTIEGESCLAVANYYDGAYNLDSAVYRWNGAAFELVQSLPTHAATGMAAFTSGGEVHLAVANYYDGLSRSIDSVVYRWNGSAFVQRQALRTHGAYDWEAFALDGEMVLAVANYYQNGVNTDSVLYRFSGPSTQRQALVDLYTSTDGDNWYDRGGWLGAPGTECTWYGVTCDGEGNVAGIDLTENNLRGPLPASLRNLSFLTSLQLWGNFLTGAVPAELGALSELLYLNLGNNNDNSAGLTGSIPIELANLTQLRELDIAGHRLTGGLPAQLGSLANLEELYLSANLLTGPIPAEIGNLSNLQVLSIGYNQLSGVLPAAIGDLSALQHLYVNNNLLSGEVPAAILDLTGLLDNGSDFRWNQMTSADPQVVAFLSQKQEGGDWQGSQAGLGINGTVMNRNRPGVGIQTYFEVEIRNFSGSLPDDIEAIVLTGPSGVLPYTRDDFTFDPQWNSFYLFVPGSPEVGLYTFTVSGNGASGTDSEWQYRNFTIPVPDVTRLSPGAGAVVSDRTPVLRTAAVTCPDYEGPLYYRYEVADLNGFRLGASDRLEETLFFTLPPLEPGQTFQWRVRVGDSDDWNQVQNRTESEWVVFSVPETLTHAREPAVDPTSWGAVTWSTDNGTGLNFVVWVHDADGISFDGSSHDVTVTYPNGTTTRSLSLYRSSSPTDAGFESYDGAYPAPGDYTFTVTDPDGNQTVWVDTLSVTPLSPPDAGSFTPSLQNPVAEAITATFDNVLVNGQPYDDFDAYNSLADLDSGKWKVSGGGIDIVDGKAVATIQDVIGVRYHRLSFADPAAVNAIQADIKIESASSNLPEARIHGVFYRDAVADVWAMLKVTNDVVGYTVGRNPLSKDTIVGETLASGDLMAATPGQTVTAAIAWNGTALIFSADGHTATYTPSGPVFPPTTLFKALRARINLVTGATPTFAWDPVPGAGRYRARVYNHDSSKTLWQGFPGETSITVPPGILEPNGNYTYRIEAWDAPSPLEVDNLSKTPPSNSDNYIFYTDGSQAEAPFIEFDSAGVQVWSGDGALVGAPFLSFRTMVHDAQGVPWDIAAVTVTFPDGTTELPLYFDEKTSATCGAYRNDYHGGVQAGTYTFTATDRDGHTYTVTEDLTVDPIGFPPADTLTPAQDTVVNGTAVDFDWPDVAGAAFYRVEIYDLDYRRLHAFATTESQYHLPAGILDEGRRYRYRITTRREFFSDNVDNGSSSPFSRYEWPTFATTAVTGGVAAPAADLGGMGAAVVHFPDPATGASRFVLLFELDVSDADGVPGNIASVVVTYPDTVTTASLRYHEALGDDAATYRCQEVFTDAGSIQSGTYTFRVTDHDGNYVDVSDTLADPTGNVVPIPVNLTPADGAAVYNQTPLLDWDDVAGAVAYKVRVYADWEEEIHKSGTLAQSQYRVPAQVLAFGRNHGYRVYAFGQDPDTNVDSLAVNTIFQHALPHFSIPDLDGPYVTAFTVRDTATGATRYTTRRTVDVALSVFDDSGTALWFLVTETPARPTAAQFRPESTVAQFTHTIAAPGDGSKLLYAWALDEAGNISVAAVQSIYLDSATAVSVDPLTTPTKVAFQTIGGLREAVGPGPIAQGATVQVSCPTATVAGVSYPSANSWSAVVQNLQPGDNRITVTSTDAYGNRATRLVTIRYSIPAAATVDCGSGYLTADGSSALTVKIDVADENGDPVPDGTAVVVNTDRGTLAGSGTTVDGMATRTLTSATELGVAHIEVRTADGLQVLGSGDVTFVAGPAVRLAFTSPPQSVVANTWSTYVVFRALDAFGNPALVYADTSVRLTSDAASGRFYTIGGGTSATNETVLNIAAGTSYGIFMYRDTAGGPRVLTVDELPDKGWLAATYDLVVTSTAPWSAVVTAAPATIAADGLSTTTLTVTVLGADGSDVDPGTLVNVTSDLGSISGGGGTVANQLTRTLRSGTVPGTAHLRVVDSQGRDLPGGVGGDTEVVFTVSNALWGGRVGPASGFGDTAFDFAVDYVNPGNAPVAKTVVVDNISHPMILIAGSAASGTYGFTKSALSAGVDHTYYFNFSDATRTYRLPSVGTFNGPLVNLKTSTVSANLARDALVYGETLIVSGAVWPARTATLTVTVTAPDDATENIAVATGADGFYTLEYLPPKAGGTAAWTAQATLPADTLFAGAVSPVQVFTVTPAATALSISATPTELTKGGRTTVSGRLTSSAGVSMAGLPVAVVFSDPEGTQTTETVTTLDAEGRFVLPDKVVDREGEWSVQALFQADDRFGAQVSPVTVLKVAPKAGYAIIVQGKLTNEDLLAWHNITANNVYSTLKDLGFADGDMRYFNYDTAQTGVFAAPSKAAVQAAIDTWALEQRNLVPAPLYIVFVDHGGLDHFYLGDEAISSTELDIWLDALEGAQSAPAAAEPIVFIYGACRSGSFIDDLAGPRRVVITSAAAGEYSYPDTPLKGETLADGEFFIKQFFHYAAVGQTVRRCFEQAAGDTRQRYQDLRLTNVFGWKFGDAGVQHPLLDDNGDGRGTHYLPVAPPGDGFVAREMVIGLPPLVVADSADLTAVVPVAVMEDDALDTALWAVGNEEVTDVWMTIKPPDSDDFTYDPEEVFVQDPGFVIQPLVFDADAGRWEYDGSGAGQDAPALAFDRGDGLYEVNFYARKTSGRISRLKRGYVVRRSGGGNLPPQPFNLSSPKNGSQATTTLTLKWENAVDPDTPESRLDYLVQIATDEAFENIVFTRQVEKSFLLVDRFFELANLTHYYWRVWAVDNAGGKTLCTQAFRFFTFNGNGIPGTLVGRVHRADNENAGIGGALVEILNTALATRSNADGWYVLQVPSGEYNLRVQAAGYDQQVHPVIVRSEDRTTLNLALAAAVDDLSPLVAVSQPPGNLFVGASRYTLAGSAADRSGQELAAIDVSVDNGETWQRASGLTNWSCAVILAKGANAILARATDRSGNVGLSDPPLSLTLAEATAPRILAVEPSPDTPLTAGSLAVTVLFNEPMDVGVAPTVAIAGQAITVSGVFRDAVTWEGTCSIPVAFNGEYRLSVSGAQDVCGNPMAPDATHAFTIDTAAPTTPVMASVPQTVRTHGVEISLAQPSVDSNFSHYQIRGGLLGEAWSDVPPEQSGTFFFVLNPMAWNTLMIRGVDRFGRVSDAFQITVYRASRLDPGNLDGDAAVGLSDAVLALRALNGMAVAADLAYDYGTSGADVNGDATVGLPEALYILQHLAELRE